MSFITRKYATLLVTGPTAIHVPMTKRGAVDNAISTDWTPVAGDVKVIIDGTAPANITNLPVAQNTANTGAEWEFILTAAELTGKQIRVVISDAATKAVEDQFFVIETFGHASAMYVTDFSAALATSAQAVALQADTDDIQTRIPAALTANGNMKSSMVEILTTALTETAGLLAGGFKKFFNIATPAATMDHGVLVDTVTAYTGNTPQTGDVYARVGAPSGASIAADIATRLPTASYVAPDNTGIANAAASASSADTKATNINAKTTNLPAAPAAVGSAMTLDFSQALSVAPTPGTVGQALAAALADGVGLATYSPPASNPGTGSLVLYAKDGTTALKTFVITTDSSGNITSRT